MIRPPPTCRSFRQKSALRFFTAYASEGAQAIDLFAAKGGSCCQLISQRFFNAVDANPASYRASVGGLTMPAVGRLASTLAGSQALQTAAAHARRDRQRQQHR